MCDHCQNCQLSSRGLGGKLSDRELVALMLKLQDRDAANINLVTAGHFTPSIVVSVASAREQGLSIPVVWNSSGYENTRSLDLLKNTVDVYLPDCKTLDPEISRQLMGAPNYPDVVQQALLKMMTDKPLVLEEDQIRRGVIVRHLVLPGLLDQSKAVLRWFAEQGKARALLSLMFQYTPVRWMDGKQSPQRTVTRREYEQVMSWLDELEINYGYVQDPAGSDDWLPDFRRANPFPAGQATPLWHFEKGYLE